MISHELKEVREYEAANEKLIGELQRPKFHLTPRIGWMNDPNGFSCYNGRYHMFYQYHPYSTNWGPMHWGHAVSSDLLHWDYLPAALAPDREYDKDGCFSGNSVELCDGRQLLMYTGVVKKEENGKHLEIQQQCIAVGDGKEYEKYSGNPVLTAEDLPEGASKVDFRDPKVWRKSDGTYCCIIGNRPADGSGQILLFSSKDGFDWKYEKVFAANNNRFGKMWECPDFFETDGKGVLLVSPQDMLAEELEYVSGNGTLCMIGSYESDGDKFEIEHTQSADYGIDFYAPQTVLSPDGRRIMIGWMQNWDTCSLRHPDHRWYGQMSIPREVCVKNGRLYQMPVREIEQMRTGEVAHRKVLSNEIAQLEGISGRCVDMELTVQPAEKGKTYKKFTMRFAQDEQFYTELTYAPEYSVFEVDRSFSGSRRAIAHKRKCEVLSKDGVLKLRIILDRFSAEVFINDGEKTVSTVIYTEIEAEGISFGADGDILLDVKKYELI